MDLFKKLFYPDHRVCRKCGILLDKDVTPCPNCGYAPFSKRPFVLFFAVLSFAALYIFVVFELTENTERQINPVSTNPVKTIEKSSQGVNIRVKPMIELNNLSVDEILKIRKDAVSQTIAFGDVSKYSPNPQVFAIEEGLPWISAYQASCIGTQNNEKICEGESRESLGILNPELLYYFIIPTYDPNRPELCSAADYMFPRTLFYYEKENTLVAYIDYTSLMKTRGNYYALYPNDANARDIGYNWAYADKFYNIKFESENNFSKQISQTKGYWHRGYSCGLQGGCNNYSPMDSAIIFSAVSLPASINIKLWKKQPRSTEQKADINFMIVLE